MIEPEDMEFISGTESLRSLSNFFAFISLAMLIIHELYAAGNYAGWGPSGASAIVLAILAVAFRVIAIDRFLRLSRQLDLEHRDLGIDV